MFSRFQYTPPQQGTAAQHAAAAQNSANAAANSAATAQRAAARAESAAKKAEVDALTRAAEDATATRGRRTGCAPANTPDVLAADTALNADKQESTQRANLTARLI